jgi:hypothetical protein
MMKLMAGDNYRLRRIVLRSAKVGIIIALTWAFLYAALGVTTLSAILAMLASGFASAFL